VTAVRPVCNEGTEVVEVVAVEASCDCTSVDPTEFTVPPGESVLLRVAIELPSQRAGGPDRRLFSESVKLLLPGMSRRDSPSWSIRGEAIAPLHFETDVVTFGSPLEYGTEYGSEVLPFVAAPAVNRVEVDSQSEGFSVASHPNADVDPCAWLLEVRPSEMLLPGRFAARIVVQAYEGAGQACGMPATVRVTGEVVADVSADPESVIFGAKPVGEGSVGRVTLRSRSGSLFRVASIDSSSENLTGKLVGTHSHHGESPLGSDFEIENDPSGREMSEWRPGAPLDPRSQMVGISTRASDDRDIEKFIEVTHTPSRVGPHDDELRVLVESDCYDEPIVVRIPVVSFGYR
jgi:hypothetical protein